MVLPSNEDTVIIQKHKRFNVSTRVGRDEVHYAIFFSENSKTLSVNLKNLTFFKLFASNSNANGRAIASHNAGCVVIAIIN